MKEWFINLWQKIKNPTKVAVVLTWIVVVLSCVAAILLAVMPPEGVAFEVLSYVAYAVAALSLAYAVYTVVLFAPRIKKGLKERIDKTPLLQRMSAQYGFRTILFSAFSLILNVAYVVLHVVLAIVTDWFFWYLSLATYYGVLVALRSGVLLYQRKKGKTKEEDDGLRRRAEIGKYRTCGILLTVLPVCLTIPLIQIFYLDRAFVKDDIMVIAFATYAFYKITMAILGVIKSQKQTDLTLRAVRNVSLADALVSIFSLQTALLFSYGAGGGYAAANMATGSAVCLLTIAMGINMIVKAHKMTKEKKEEENE